MVIGVINQLSRKRIWNIMKLWTCLPYPKPLQAVFTPSAATHPPKASGLQSLQELQIIWQAIIIQVSRLQAPMDSQLWDMYLPWEPGEPNSKCLVVSSQPLKNTQLTSHLSQSYLKYGWKQWIFLTSPDNGWTYIQHVWTTRHLK